MLIISHRGNTLGPNPEFENHPDRIIDVTNTYDCEIDVWVVDDKIFLGHDKPQYEVKKEFLFNQRLWCHAKNLQALHYLLSLNVKCFYHNVDDYTLVSNGLIWAYPGMPVNCKSIIVDKSKDWRLNNYKCYGVCVDYIL